MYKIVFLADSVSLLRILFCKKEELEKVEAAGAGEGKINRRQRTIPWRVSRERRRKQENK